MVAKLRHTNTMQAIQYHKIVLDMPDKHTVSRKEPRYIEIHTNEGKLMNKRTNINKSKEETQKNRSKEANNLRKNTAVLVYIPKQHLVREIPISNKSINAHKLTTQ